MPWKEFSTMDLRYEFVRLAHQQSMPFRALCKRYGISTKTGYKWLARFELEGDAGLADRSRRPHHSPATTSAVIESAILEVRAQHPAWGARKILPILYEAGWEILPSPSTVTAILKRHGCLSRLRSRTQRDLQRFEAEAPNLLWQMDFKGDFRTARQRCYPLTVLDDHSRFSLAIDACANQQRDTVQKQLIRVFLRYGMPGCLLTDNGGPWGSSGYEVYSIFEIWLMDLGIGMVHSRPRHPQTCGKLERFHRSLKAEVLGDGLFASLTHCQERFDQWRTMYNTHRPHEALGFAVPASRYEPSPRMYPSHIERFLYDTGDMVRIVSEHGDIRLRGAHYRIGKAFTRREVVLRETPQDGVLDVYYRAYCIAELNLHTKRVHLRRPHRGQDQRHAQ